MGFVKVVKNKAYYKRYQVQFRRRRECKTDYYARRRLIWVDKNKYDAPKFRFVVRFSNRDVTCAIIASDLRGDRIVASAYGHELARYGVKFGFNNFPSTYATGLLLARKVNTKFDLPFVGVKDAAGREYNVADGEDGYEDDSGETERRPFKAVLDVGLHRTTTGSRLFAALKGLCDGGVNVPHSTSRFPGSTKKTKNTPAETDFEVTRKYVFGGHVADYMNSLAEESPEDFDRQFAIAKREGITGADIEALYQSVHAKIRAETKDSLGKVKQGANNLGYFKTRKAAKAATPVKGPKYFDTTKNRIVYIKKKMPVQQRKARIVSKLKKFFDAKKAAAAAVAAPAAATAEKEEEEEAGSDSGSGSGSDDE